MNANTNVILLAIVRQLKAANMLHLAELTEGGPDKTTLRRIALNIDELPELKEEPAKSSGAGVNAVRAAAGLPAYSGPEQSIDPGIYGRNLRAFTLEILYTEVDQLRRKADNTAAREALHAVQNILDRHINANIAEGNNAAAKAPAPVPARESYRDPDLSDKWLAEAEWRARHDRTRKYRIHDNQLITERLVAEVRRLNEMLGR